jgi:hypothetical protein
VEKDLAVGPEVPASAAGYREGEVKFSGLSQASKLDRAAVVSLLGQDTTVLALA